LPMARPIDPEMFAEYQKLLDQAYKRVAGEQRVVVTAERQSGASHHFGEMKHEHCSFRYTVVMCNATGRRKIVEASLIGRRMLAIEGNLEGKKVVEPFVSTPLPATIAERNDLLKTPSTGKTGLGGCSLKSLNKRDLSKLGVQKKDAHQ
jgi:hypothetical protein